LAHNNLGNSLLDQGKLDEAIGEYRAALRIDPGWAQVHYNLAEALRQQGDRAGTAHELRDFLRLVPVPSRKRRLNALETFWQNWKSLDL
jgi:tetratricopeptide (TPR) repeat protein